METIYKNKAVDTSKETTKEQKVEGQAYTFPEHGITVYANSIDEAEIKLNKIIKK
jgi:hypothetical protein